MPATVRRLSTYRFGDTDRLLFDANIWLFLYSPQYGPQDRRVRIYSAGLKNILAARSRIFIDALVLSEFINTSARFAYNRSQPKPVDFKTYRNSSAFVPVARAISDACRRILRYATRIESDFASLDINALLTSYASGKIDFNDQVIAQLCNQDGLALVTHDADLRGLALNILTENPRLLN
jgi:predicted nucleic acid-binding protein